MSTRIFPKARSTRSPGSRPRSAVSHGAPLLLLIAPLLLSGCARLFYPAASVPELLEHETFNYHYDEWSRLGERWTLGSYSTFGIEAALLPGRVEIYGLRHYMRSRNAYDPDLSALLEWSVINGDVFAPTPQPLSEDPDFTITFDELDIIVALELYRGGNDTLRVYRKSGFPLGSATVPSGELTGGTLELRLETSGTKATITAAAAELGLEITSSVSMRDRTATPVTFGASGLHDHPRCLETVYLYRPVSDLWGAQ